MAAVSFYGTATVNEHDLVPFGYFGNRRPYIIAKQKFRVVSENKIFHIQFVFKLFHEVVDPLHLRRNVNVLRTVVHTLVATDATLSIHYRDSWRILHIRTGRNHLYGSVLRIDCLPV